MVSPGSEHSGLDPSADAGATAAASARDSAAKSESTAVTGEVLTDHPSAAFRRRWLLAITLASLLGACAAAAAWYFMPVRVLVYAQVYVSSSKPSILVTSNEDYLGFTNFLNTQILKIKQATLLSKALNEAEKALPGVRKRLIPQGANDVEWLENKLLVDYGHFGSPEFLRIALTGDDPDALKVVVESIRTIYLREESQKDATDRALQLKRLEQAYDDYSNQLKREKQDLQRLALENVSGDAQARNLRHGYLLQQINHYRQELWTLQLELLKSEAIAELKKNTLPPAIETQLRKTTNNNAESEALTGEAKMRFQTTYRNKLISTIQNLEAQAKQLNANSERMLSDEDDITITILQDVVHQLGTKKRLLELELKAPYRAEPFEAPKVETTADHLKITGVAGLGTFGLVLFGVCFFEVRARRIGGAGAAGSR